MTITLLEIPVSGWTCLRTKRTMYLNCQWIKGWRVDWEMQRGNTSAEIWIWCEMWRGRTLAQRYGSDLIFQAVNLESGFTMLYRIRSVVNYNNQWPHFPKLSLVHLCKFSKSCQFTVNFSHVSSYEFLLLPMYILLLDGHDLKTRRMTRIDISHMTY